MTDGPDPERLDALEDRLQAARKAQEPAPAEESHYTAAQAGWRMVTELVVGLAIGFGIGYALDRFFGTEPWCMLVFTMFGFAAGIKVMMRTAAEIQQKNSAVAAPGQPGKSEMYDDD